MRVAAFEIVQQIERQDAKINPQSKKV